MKAAVYHTPGDPSVLRYETVPNPSCAPDGVVLEVEAISVEGGDLINRATALPPVPQHVLGYAAAGTIIQVGANVCDRQIGQRVTSFDTSGSHASLRAVQASRTWVLPEKLNMAAASALPISFGTAYHALFSRGALTNGESVLIQGGAGGVGVAAIQLASRAGATVIATVSGDERVDRLKRLGLTHAIDYRRADVMQEVMKLTGGKGADLVIDSVGSTLQASLSALRSEGRLVFVGNAGRSSLTADLWPALQENQTMMGVFMGSQFEKPAVYRSVAQMLDLAAAGQLQVIIDRTFPLAEAAAAHTHAELGSVLGRVVLVP